jgi:hypothetical protein
MKEAKPRQFSLAFLFELTLLIAVLLGLWRIYPSREIDRSFFLALVSEAFVVIVGGTAIGAFIGGLSRDRARSTKFGFALGVFLAVFLVGFQIVMVLNY